MLIYLQEVMKIVFSQGLLRLTWKIALDKTIGKHLVNRQLRCFKKLYSCPDQNLLSIISLVIKYYRYLIKKESEARPPLSQK